MQGRATSLGRLLIVDDEAPVRDVLDEYFAGQGYAVDTASDGAAALAAARRRRPDLVLLDVRMPGVDGLEVLRRLRELDASVPVIMVTANEDVGLARETLRVGAFDYVAKPFDFAYLDRAVSAAMLQLGLGGHDKVAEDPDDPWRRLARTVFRAVRSMREAGRASTGHRMEAAALAAARHGTTGEVAAAAGDLGELRLLSGIAAELGDLVGPEQAAVETALEDARRTLGPPG